MVAVTLQVPVDVAVSTAPETLQPVAVPLVTEKLTAPVPEPPEVVSVIPLTPVVELTVRAVWFW